MTGVICATNIYHIYVINRIEDYKKKEKVKEFSHPADIPFFVVALYRYLLVTTN